MTMTILNGLDLWMGHYWDGIKLKVISVSSSPATKEGIGSSGDVKLTELNSSANIARLIEENNRLKQEMEALKAQQGVQNPKVEDENLAAQGAPAKMDLFMGSVPVKNKYKESWLRANKNLSLVRDVLFNDLDPGDISSDVIRSLFPLNIRDQDYKKNDDLKMFLGILH